MREIERQRALQREREEQQRLQEEQRQRNAEKPIIDIPDNKSGIDYLSDSFGKFTSDVDKLFSMNTIKDLGKEIQSVLPGDDEDKKLKEEEDKKRREEENKRKNDTPAATEEKSGLEVLSAGFKKFTSDVDKFFSMNTLKGLGIGKNEEERKQDGGWKIDTSKVVRSVECEDDPFAIQREQLLSYIAQAREEKRFDEVRALEHSLHEIETAMREQKMSHGF